jgi:predicted dehydrogenase
LASDQARQLTLLAEKNQRILQVGHIFRHDTATQWLRQAMQNGEFGQVHILRGNFSGFKRPRHDSGVTFADAIHFVDLFNYLMGRRPVAVTAVMQDFLGRGMDDASWLSLEYPEAKGTTWATIETNYFLPGKFREIMVIGSALSAVCDYNVAQYKIKTFHNQHLKSGRDFKATEGAVQQIECVPEEPLLMELRAFLDSMDTRRPPRADGWAGVYAVQVLEAARESARTGKKITLAS